MKKPIAILCLLFLFLTGCGAGVEEAARDAQVEPKTARIVAFGDLMFHRPQLNAAQTEEGYDFKDNFNGVEPFINDADIAMINLETTLTDGEKGYTTFPVFSSPSELAYNLKEVGFDIISTANNHAYDKQGEGTEKTYDYLKEAGLDVIGTQTKEPDPLVKDVNGIKIGFLSYTYGLNGFDHLLEESDKPYAVSVFSKERVERDMARLNERGADIVVCYMHWGEEYTNEPTETQKEQAKFLAEQGVSLILGSHPHVPQGVDNIPGSRGTTYVAYSMGNFVSNQRRENMSDRRVEMGQMVRADIVKDEKGTRVAAFEPEALYVDKYWTDKLHYEVVPARATLAGEIPNERLDVIRPRLEETLEHQRRLVDPKLVVSVEDERS
ncbi:MAG: CapA family protein [Peptoniphilus sp.]|nr:CapA family protein [Peptoniphilus sp.]MDD7362729.1 CapA family protein [Bacillota bacterium]MDY6044577.1 CapA family protein [Peptoniphilus sp.]